MSNEDTAWCRKRLGDLVQEGRPICYGVLKPGPYERGGVPLLRIVDLLGDRVAEEGLHRITSTLDREFSRSRLNGGELLLSIQGTIGRVALAPENLAGANISRTIARIDLDAEAHPSFVRHWMLSDRGQKAFDDTIVGTTRSSLNIGALRALEIPLPPLPEQQLIASILDTVDEVIRRTEEVIAKLQQMKQGLLHDLLTRGIDDNGELRDPDRHPEQFKDSPLGKIPKEWEVEELGAFLLGRPTNGLYKPPHEIGAGMLIVGQTAFTAEDSVDFNEARRARVTNTEYTRYGLRARDILVTRVYATVDGVGRPVIVPESSEPAVYESNMMRVRIKPSEFDPRLLHAWMRGFRARGHIRAKANSSNQTSINQGAVVSMPCPKPGPGEQARMVASIDAADSRVRAEEGELAKLRLLKSGLMDDLLTGRVRVIDLLPSSTP